jgi:hypothetical protein
MQYFFLFFLIRVLYFFDFLKLIYLIPEKRHTYKLAISSTKYKRVKRCEKPKLIAK